MSESTPPKRPADEVLRLYTPRRGVVRLNRRSVAVIIAVLGLIVGGALLLGLKQSRRDGRGNPFDNDFGRAPDHAIDAGPLGGLPEDYRYVQPPPKVTAVEPQAPKAEPQMPEPIPVQPVAPQPITLTQPAPVQPPRIEDSSPPIDPQLIARLRELQRQLDESINSPIVFGNVRRQIPALPTLTNATGHLAPDTSGQQLRFDTSAARDNDLTFIRNASNVNTHVRSKLQKPRSPYEIQAGTVIPGALVTALQSDLPGTVVGQVTENVYDSVSGKHLLIPQASRLVGVYNTQLKAGQDRLFVVWQRVILPNGNSIVLEGMAAADPSGASGLKDQVDHHLDRLLGATVLSSLIAYGGNLAKGNSDSRDGVSIVGETVAQQASRIGQRIVDRELNVQPTVRIRAGWPFVVLVNKDISLRPYRRHE